MGARSSTSTTSSASTTSTVTRSGDAALRQVAKFLLGALRETDVVGRWGGDEFLAVLPDCSEEGLRRICETLAENQQTLVIEGPGAPDGPPVPVRFSVGGATASTGNQTLEALVERADQARYQVKKTSRSDRRGQGR